MMHFPGLPTCLVCAGLLLPALAGCQQQEQSRAYPAPTVKGAIATPAVLATIPPDAVLTPPGSSDPAKIVVNEEGKGAVYVAYRNGKSVVVHNGRSGPEYDKVANVSLSPDGQHVAYGVTVQEKQRRIVWDGREGDVYVDVWNPVFSPDNRHIAYIAQIGEDSHIVVDGSITGAYPSLLSGNPVFAADASHVAFHLTPGAGGKGRLVVASRDLKHLKSWDCVNHEMVLDADRTRAAAVVPAEGKQRAVIVSLLNPEEIKEGPLYEEVTGLTLSPDGASFAYVAVKEGRRYLVLDGKEEPLPEGEMRQPPVVKPGGKGAGIILTTGKGFRLHPGFGGGKDGRSYQEAAGLIYSKDGSQTAYLARREKSIFAVVNGKESPGYDMIVTPKFSPDGRFLVCRARKDGRRFVVVLDRDGKVVREHPRYEMVFDVTFTPDGKSVAYGIKEGRQLAWEVEKL
ncbi:lipoprotein, putative [Citrifermentans bemidjiense Bem]|uniref:Lipoprotein, putative n=1 Tax=Citrifermentans bemidjiense (strain ATCC BAA-1014 / DSM 16622 / JCM 12645 / Bem) TaxID=404380 RepID=B5EHG7_CITBB|nr:hypothetical protein [Citrifermentans bemidjiense]ACH38177.1 lipoprotein, putative [Citrifermentans bemidjiense Bem]